MKLLKFKCVTIPVININCVQIEKENNKIIIYTGSHTTGVTYGTLEDCESAYLAIINILESD